MNTDNKTKDISERFQAICITEESVGQRLDKIMVLEWQEFTRSRIQSMIKAGDILINNNVIKPSYKLRENDVINFRKPDLEPATLTPRDIPLDVLYEDSDIIIVSKERGMVVHPGAGVHDNTLVHALLFHCNDLSGIGGVLRPGIVHRLDKGTSGIILVAKNDVAHVGLAKQFAERLINKEYYALITGCPEWLTQTVDQPIGRHKTHRVKMAISEQGRDSKTEFHLLAYSKSGSLLAARPKSGRTHQIRVHLEYLRHPVLGDPLYGQIGFKTPPGSVMKALRGMNGFCLHAGKITFIHPVKNVPMTIYAPLPEDMLNVIKVMGLLDIDNSDWRSLLGEKSDQIK